MSTRTSRRLVLAGALAAAGCAGNPFAPPPPIPPVLAAAPPPAPASGSLYSPARFAALASDDRARRVGDVLTIRLTERMQSRKSASSDTSRDSATAIDLPDFWPFNQVAEKALDGGMKQHFNGAGGAAQDNLLQGQITVTVAAVLPNGVLAVQGEKRVVINRGEEQVMLTGLVRPQDIAPDNSVPSIRVANAQIRYSGTGQVAAASRAGWLARFFAAVAPL